MQDQPSIKDTIENALILYANLPSKQVAEILAKEALSDVLPDRGLKATLSPGPGKFLLDLARAYFLRKIQAAREKERRANHEQYRLDGLDHCPLHIVGDRNKRIDLLDAKVEDVRKWVQGLNSRKRNDFLIQEANALLEKMRSASKTDRGISVRRALAKEGLVG